MYVYFINNVGRECTFIVHFNIAKGYGLAVGFQYLELDYYLHMSIRINSIQYHEN